MAIAKVNIENVEVFRQSIETQRNAVSDNIDIVNSTVNEAKETVNLEKEKALALIDEAQETLSTLKIKIDEQQNKVEHLQAELSALEASEPRPAEELVVEPDEYDEEGNLISVGSSYYEETSAHISWRNEVAKLESELRNEEARLSQMQAVEGQLQSILARVEQEQAKLEELYFKLEANQEEVNTQKNSFEGYSEDATDKLNKINSVLDDYLSTSISSYSLSSRSFNPSLISRNMVTSSTNSHIFDSSRSDYSSYHYAREAVNNTKQYIENTDTPVHEYERCHLDKQSLPAYLKLTDNEWRVLNEEREKAETQNKSRFYKEITYDEFKNLITIGLLNSQAIENRSNANSIYQAKFPYPIGYTTCESTGEVKVPENTLYLTIVIGRDRKTNERVISAYPGRSRQAIRNNIR